MNVWGEVLFAENFLAGYGILMMTALICGRSPGRIRMVTGAGFCGLFSFVLLLEISSMKMGAMGVPFALLLTGIVFRPESVQRALRIAGIFYLVSFLTGGCVMAMLFFSGIPGIICNGVFYTEQKIYGLIIAGLTVSVAAACRGVRFVGRAMEARYGRIRLEIELQGKQLYCKGKVDTGNGLREPLSGKPVSVIERSAAEKAWHALLDREATEERVRMVPFQCVGSPCGMMKALRCDRMTLILGRGISERRREWKDTYIGLYDGKFVRDGSGESYEVLLQPELLSGRWG